LCPGSGDGVPALCGKLRLQDPAGCSDGRARDPIRGPGGRNTAASDGAELAYSAAVQADSKPVGHPAKRTLVSVEGPNPLREPSMQAISEQAPQQWSALVVDDAAGIRQSLRMCLDAAGGRVLGVGTAAAALEALDRRAYDLVLLDLWLGADSGMAVVPEILS